MKIIKWLFDDSDGKLAPAVWILCAIGLLLALSTVEQCSIRITSESKPTTGTHP